MVDQEEKDERAPRLSSTDPLEVLRAWRDEAADAGELDPDAMSLASSTPDGRPSVRIVLLRGIEGGALRFYTNYLSRKGQELDDNPFAAVCFHWPRLKRQVRVEGKVHRLEEAISDAYFNSRPRGHRLGAIVSPQSRSIESIEALRERARILSEQWEESPIPRPSHWGGYGLIADRVELWIAGEDRLHERRLFTRDEGSWFECRLAP